MRLRKLVLLLAALTAGAGAAVFGVTHRAHGSSRPALFKLSATGRPIVLARSSARSFRVSSASLVAVRDGRAFYRLVTADGLCFATGPASDRGEIGGDACPPPGTFPSAARPILDLSVYESNSHVGHAVRAVRIEGFAADGVASVALRTPSGRESARVPVSQNVFELHAVEPAAVGSIVGLDSGGQEVASLGR